MISLKIDVTKIDKSRLYKGKKGTYLSAVLIETPDSEYGDYMIVEDVSYDERQAGKRGTILGNGKIVMKKEYKVESHNNEPDSIDITDDVDKLPF